MPQMFFKTSTMLSNKPHFKLAKASNLEPPHSRTAPQKFYLGSFLYCKPSFNHETISASYS